MSPVKVKDFIISQKRRGRHCLFKLFVQSTCANSRVQQVYMWPVSDQLRVQAKVDYERVHKELMQVWCISLATCMNPSANEHRLTTLLGTWSGRGLIC